MTEGQNMDHEDRRTRIYEHNGRRFTYNEFHHIIWLDSPEERPILGPDNEEPKKEKE